MNIEALVDPAPAVLCTAAARPDVTSAMNEAHMALTDLRFSERLRRGWEEARAEAAVCKAAVLSIIEGARTNVDDVHTLSMADEGGAASNPRTTLTLGIWRSQWNLASRLPALNTQSQGVAHVASTPLPALITGLHRDTYSGLATASFVESQSVAMPIDPSLLASILTYMYCDAPSLAVTATLTVRFHSRCVFNPVSSVVGGRLARRILVTRGVDPTDVCVPNVHGALDSARTRHELAGWVSADEAGLARWIIYYYAGVVCDAQVGRDVAHHMQAGRLSQDYFSAAQERTDRRANDDAGDKRHRDFRGYRNLTRQDAHRGREREGWPVFALYHLTQAVVRVNCAGAVDEAQERRV